MKKKLMALCLAGIMSVGAFGGIPFVSDAAENEQPVGEEVYEEGIIESMVDDNGDVLTAIVPYTEEEIQAREEAEGKIPARFLKNLSEYAPGYEELTDSVEADAAGTPGIDNITPSEGNVKSLVIFTDFADLKYKQQFKDDFKKRVFASDPNPEYTKLEGETEFSTPDVSNYPYDSLRGYYQRSSFGTLNFWGEFYEFTSGHDREWYEQGDPVTQDNTLLYQDAVDAWVAAVLNEEAHKTDNKTNLEYLDERLSEFDSDGDFQLDNCYFLCAGGNNGWGSRWWSYRGGSEIMIGSYRLSRFIQMVDNISKEGVAGGDEVNDYIQTMIHETGHNLGLDDYYSYADQNEGDDPKLRTEAMMFGNTSDQDGFAKMLLGWIPKEKVWVITDKQVWNPQTKAWEDYTGSYPLALGSYAKTGDLALIIPKKDTADDWNWIYDQSIMVEYYKNELNDNIKPAVGALPVQQDGLRIFHIYGKLSNNKFIASNTQDTMIPLISDYYKEHEDETKDYLGVFLPDDELTPASNPASSFFSNPSDDGLTANTKVVDSGISITKITRTEDEKMSFETSIVDPFAEGPTFDQSKTALEYDEEEGWYVKVTFNCPVNYIGGKDAVVYDYDPVKNQYDSDEKWGEITRVGRMVSDKHYKRDTNVLYYMLDNVHSTDGMIIIPEGSVMSDRGVLCKDLYASISNKPDGTATLSTTPATGVTYEEPQKVTINGTGLPEGSKIYYTLDGTEPYPGSNTAKVYENPIDIEATAVVKALAFDGENRPVTARLLATYIFEKVYFIGENQDQQLKEKTITLDVKEKFSLDPSVNIWAAEDADRTISYESDDPKTVMVDDYGNLTALKEGTAHITVSSRYTGEKPATCTVNVVAGSASKVLEEVKKVCDDPKKAGDVMRQISTDLYGWKTLKEFGEDDTFGGIWVASIPAQTYTGKPVKPEIRVYDGVKVIDPKNYTVTYKNNKNAGTAKVTVKIKKSYKNEKVAPVNSTFAIDAVNLDTGMMALEMGVKYTGKLQKPKPILLWKSTGAKQALKTSDFTITYKDASGQEVKGVQDEGTYTATISSKSKNFASSIDARIQVQKTDILDKVNVKIMRKLDYTKGKAAVPEFGTHYSVSAPKGFTAIAEKDFTDGKFTVQYIGNFAPGKMALIIRPGKDTGYVGAKVAYLTIK